MQRELRDAAAARDAHKEALDLAQQGLTQLEDALAKEQAIHQDSCARWVHSFCADATSFGIARLIITEGQLLLGLVGVDWCPPMKGVDEGALTPIQVAQLEADVEDAARRKAAADVEAARAVEAARSELAAAQREAEVLRAGAGADKDSALAGLKVPVRAPGAQHAVMQCVQRPWRTILSLQTSQSPCHGQVQQCRYPVCNISCGMQ